MRHPYLEYRNSGVEWIGELPRHWSTQRMATLFEQVSEPGRDELPILSVSIHSGVSDDEIDPEDMDRMVARSEDRTKYKSVQEGDLVYNMMRAWQGGFGTVSTDGMVSPAYVVARPKRNVTFDTKFVERLLRTPLAVEEMRRYSRGVTDFRLRLYWDEFKELRVALPPLAEQQAIAAFLDRETGKIDALVEEQRRLIELLREKRQAVISHAVTKGLDPTVPMKPSGIDWLGDIPAHWEVGAIKRFFDSLDGRRIPLSSTERGERQGDIPYYGASGVIDYVDDYIFDEDLVLVSEDGANLLNRSTPISFVAKGKYWVNNHAHILRPRFDQIEYWCSRIEALDVTTFVTGAAQPKLTIEALLNMSIAVPPTASERAAIVAYINYQGEQLGNLQIVAQRSVELLQERRAAMISAAVTGKIDVRETANVTEAA